MNYDLRIAMAERELAHLKEMQRLEQARVDAHDQSILSLEKMHLRHAQAIEEHDEAVKQHDREMKELRGIVQEIGVMLKNFIASMQAGAKNGKEQA